MARLRYVGDSAYRSTDTGQLYPGDVAEVSDPSHWEESDDFEIVESDDEPEGSEEDTDDEPETCEVVKSDGEVCGRELPCAYHTEDD